MNRIFQKTFASLSTQYYFRQLFFGLLPAAFVYFISSQSGAPLSIEMLATLIVNTLLYPYSRFVYESIVDFILGNNAFFTSAVFMLLAKFMTMLFCWACAIFIAPVGLIYLYFYHSRQ